MNIHIASDHAGFFIKEAVKVYLTKQGYNVIDYGTNSPESVDYPDFVHKLMEKFLPVANEDIAILVCGSGNGVCMTANKYPDIRAALVWNPELSELAKKHNDANVICLPGRFVSVSEAQKIVSAFLNAKFEGGRHLRRINKIKL